MKITDTAKLVVWEGLNPFLLQIKKRRRYHFNGSYAGINIGCGMDNPSNWLGVDGGVYVLLHNLPVPILRIVSRFMKTGKNYSAEDYIRKIRSTKIIHHELHYGLPFDDNSIPAVFSSHFLEHLTREDASQLLRESFRVLKPGGIIRIVVPSLDVAVATIRDAITKYESGDLSEIQPFVTQSTVGYVNKYDNHRWMYDFAEMRNILQGAGFVDIREESFKVGRMQDVEKLDTRPGIFVEGLKP